MPHSRDGISGGRGGRPRPERRVLAIVDSTLREGEQRAGVRLTAGRKLEIALALEEFGVDYIELTSPAASPAARDECRMVARAVSRSTVLAHIRCSGEDAALAIDTGVGGINFYMATSPRLRAASGLGSLEDAMRRAVRAMEFVSRRAPMMQLRISCEDAFRTPADELYGFIGAMEATGLPGRIGLADTAGAATPLEVHRLVSEVRARSALQVEFHGHNDTGCAVANSLMAIEAGCTHVDVSVLGLGERNGITPLAGLVARLYATYPGLLDRYRLERLTALHELTARALGVGIPDDHCIVGGSAFNHKAGVHIRAVGRDAGAYEAVPPEAFGAERKTEINSRLVGWHAVHAHSAGRGVALGVEEARRVAGRIKSISDARPMGMPEVDELLAEAAFMGK